MPTALTPRMLEILRLTARGFTSTEIGQQLGTSPKTVRTQQEQIRRRLDARSMAHAVAIARWEDLLEDGEPVPAST